MPLEGLSGAKHAVSVAMVIAALSWPQVHTPSEADRIPQNVSAEGLVMALLRGAPFTPSLYLVGTTSILRRKEGRVPEPTEH